MLLEGEGICWVDDKCSVSDWLSCSGGTCVLVVCFEKSLALTWRVVNVFQEHGTA